MREKTPEKVKKLIEIANAAYLNQGRTPDELAELLNVNKAELIARDRNAEPLRAASVRAGRPVRRVHRGRAGLHPPRARPV